MRSFTQNLLSTGSLMAAMAVARATDDSMASMTLADFAEMETDDIQALDSLLFPMGVYGCRVLSSTLGMQASDPTKLDEETGLPLPPLFYCETVFEVVEADPTDKKNQDPEKLVGRKITDRQTFWPKQRDEMIGLLKGKYKKAGFNINGRMGGVEGAEPGWIDSAVDQFAIIRVRHSKPNAEGRQRIFIDWDKAPTAGEQEAA